MNQPVENRHESPASFFVIKILGYINPAAEKPGPHIPLLAAEHSDVRFNEFVAVPEEVILSSPNTSDPLYAVRVEAVIVLCKWIVTPEKRGGVPIDLWNPWVGSVSRHFSKMATLGCRTDNQEGGLVSSVE